MSGEMMAELKLKIGSCAFPVTVAHMAPLSGQRFAFGFRPNMPP